MISSILQESQDTKEKIKLWLSVAKKHKQVTTLYIIDNLLKNTQCICEEKGIIDFIRHFTFAPKRDREISIYNILTQQSERFKKENINVFNSIYLNYFLDKVK
jgi:hypothetical protein